MGLYQKFGSIDLEMEVEWKGCSGGEREIVSFVRILLAKPKLLFLDEVTAGLAPYIEEKLYEIISTQTSLTYISIAHRPGIRKFHSREINITYDGEIEIRKVM